MLPINPDLTASASEDRVLGALLGMAIGDALGMPVAGWDAAKIADRLGRIDGYQLRVLEDGTEIPPGEITDETEFALAIIEGLTTNGGRIAEAVDTIGARLVYLAAGDSARWLTPVTISALERAAEMLDFTVPLADDGPATGDVAARGIPIGLLHAVGRFDSDALRADAEAVTRITHGAPAAIAATTAVAYGVMLAARSVAPDRWLGDTAAFLGAGELADALRRADALPARGEAVTDAIVALGSDQSARLSVPAAFLAASRTDLFHDAVVAAVNAGGAADTIGAIAGALAGAYGGDTSIPQPLIDGLGSRIYVSLAAPWFFKTAQQRAGLFIGLRPAPPRRPTEPPRV